MDSKIIESYKDEKVELFNKNLGIIFNGDDNRKPTVIENLLFASPTASQCAWIYQTFLGGAGFEFDMSKFNLSEDEFELINPNDLLFDVSESCSVHQGSFIHVNYNMNYQKHSFEVLPYSLCRLGKEDSDNFSGKIAVSKKGWGKRLKKEEIDIIDVYNPRPEVIQAQVDKAGGWHKYKGQILFFRFSKKYTYPRSLLESCYTFADVENQLGIYYNSTTKRAFEDITIIRHRKFESKQAEREFDENIRKLSGLNNSSSKMRLEDDWDDEREKSGNFKFDTLKNNVAPEKYKHFETASSNYIRKSFKDIPPILVDALAGKLGASTGDDYRMAQALYNARISKDQEKLEIMFSELFRNYKEDINPSKNWTIKQYALLDNGTIDYTKQPTEQPVA